MVGHVFISYAHEDREYCERLATAIRKMSLECWFDRLLRQGDSWVDGIEEKIDGCAAFVVIASKHSSRREGYVRKELGRAVREKKRIFPVRLADVSVLQLDDIHGVDVFDGGLPDEKWFAELREAVRSVLGEVFRPSLVSSFGQEDDLRTAALSPDATQVAAVGQTRRVKIWSPGGELRRVVGAGTDLDGGAATALALWSPDGGRLLTGVRDGSLRVWDTAGDAVPLEIPAPRTGGEDVRTAAWSPDGTMVAFVGQLGGGTVVVPGSQAAFDLTKFDGQISAIAFSRDGLYVTTGHVDGMVRRFHARSGEPESVLPVAAFDSQRRINCLAWSPNGHVLALGGDDGNLVVLDWPAEVGSRPTLRVVGDHKHDPIWGVAWSPDGRYIATAGGDERVCVWDLLTGFQFSIPHPASVWSVSWSADVRLLATACRDGWARVWSLWHGQGSGQAEAA